MVLFVSVTCSACIQGKDTHLALVTRNKQLETHSKKHEQVRENIQKGALEFFFLRSGWTELAKGIATYGTERLDTDEIYEMFSAEKVSIETPEPFTVFADGEVN